MAQSPGLSVCMIVKDESANIGAALACFAPFADEIIVADTGSRDNTKEIAARFTSKIYDLKWTDDFASARNFAMSKAGRSYQLWVDADDRISPENQRHIQSLKSHFDGRKAFYFILENHRPDSPPSFCRQLRCVPVMEGVKFEGRIHEQIFPGALRAGLEMATTDIVITHLGYMTEGIRVAKLRRNLAILESERAGGRNDGALYFFLASTYEHLGRTQEAMRNMEEALEHFRKENYNHHLIPEGYLFMARLSLSMEDHDTCLRCLATVGSLAGGNPLYNFHMGILYQKMGRHREALEVFREVSGKEYAPGLFPTQPLPNPAELLLHMAYSFYCMNDRQRALELINSPAHGTEIGRRWEWLGTKAFVLKNIAFANIAFEAALRYGNLEPASWRRLGAVYKQHGFSEKARECFVRAGICAEPSPGSG